MARKTCYVYTWMEDELRELLAEKLETRQG